MSSSMARVVVVVSSGEAEVSSIVVSVEEADVVVKERPVVMSGTVTMANVMLGAADVSMEAGEMLGGIVEPDELLMVVGVEVAGEVEMCAVPEEMVVPLCVAVEGEEIVVVAEEVLVAAEDEGISAKVVEKVDVVATVVGVLVAADMVLMDAGGDPPDIVEEADLLVASATVVATSTVDSAVVGVEASVVIEVVRVVGAGVVSVADERERTAMVVSGCVVLE